MEFLSWFVVVVVVVVVVVFLCTYSLPTVL